jgi:hypothetical protein
VVWAGVDPDRKQYGALIYAILASLLEGTSMGILRSEQLNKNDLKVWRLVLIQRARTKERVTRYGKVDSV